MPKQPQQYALILKDADIRKLKIDGPSERNAHLWTPCFQNIILHSFDGLLPKASDLTNEGDHSDEWRFELKPDGKSLLDWSRAKPLGPKDRVPSASVRSLELAANDLATRADHPKVPPDYRKVTHAFRLPDPDTASDRYRMFGPPWNRKLTILWGYEQPGQPPAVLPHVALGKLRKRSYDSDFARKLWTRVLPAVAVLLLILAAFGGSYARTLIKQAGQRDFLARLQRLEQQVESLNTKIGQVHDGSDNLHQTTVALLNNYDEDKLKQCQSDYGQFSSRNTADTRAVPDLQKDLSDLKTKAAAMTAEISRDQRQRLESRFGAVAEKLATSNDTVLDTGNHLDVADANLKVIIGGGPLKNADELCGLFKQITTLLESVEEKTKEWSALKRDGHGLEGDVLIDELRPKLEELGKCCKQAESLRIALMKMTGPQRESLADTLAKKGKDLKGALDHLADANERLGHINQTLEQKPVGP